MNTDNEFEEVVRDISDEGFADHGTMPVPMSDVAVRVLANQSSVMYAELIESGMDHPTAMEMVVNFMWVQVDYIHLAND